MYYRRIETYREKPAERKLAERTAAVFSIALELPSVPRIHFVEEALPAPKLDWFEEPVLGFTERGGEEFSLVCGLEPQQIVKMR